MSGSDLPPLLVYLDKEGISYVKMIFHIIEARNCWLFLPHGEEPVAWYCNSEGGDVLRAAGWRPFEMHCVSGFVREQLLASGDLKLLYDLNARDRSGNPCVHSG
jgi:hypothetical protein